MKPRLLGFSMTLKILLPFRVFSESADVSCVIAETLEGSFGFLPNRLDCVAALAPGILTYQSGGAGEVILAVDEGVLVKVGSEILVSVRNAIEGKDLSALREVIDRQFLDVDQEERRVRDVMAKLESGFIHRLGEFNHE